MFVAKSYLICMCRFARIRFERSYYCLQEMIIQTRGSSTRVKFLIGHKCTYSTVIRQYKWHFAHFKEDPFSSKDLMHTCAFLSLRVSKMPLMLFHGLTEKKPLVHLGHIST